MRHDAYHGGVLDSYLRGAAQPFRGLLFLLRERSLWKYALVPFAINLLVVGLALLGLAFVFDDVFAYATAFTELPKPSVWYRWLDYGLLWLLKWLVGALLLIVGLALTALLFLLLGAVIASPFNDVLAERVEALSTGRGRPEPPFSIGALLSDGARSVLEELRKAGFFLVVFLGLLPLNLIPLAGTLLYAAASTTLSAFFLTLEFCDYAMSRRRLVFREKRALLLRHRGAALGFGSVMFLVLAVPLANLLLLPVGVVAGTRLFLELEGSESVPGASS